jgi:phosphatidylglycerol lysyltransferase
VEALERYGVAPLSFLLRYEAPWRWFDGAIAYLEAPRAAVAWSDPLCSDGDRRALLDAFTRAMRAEGRGVCLVAVGEGTARDALAAGFSALKVGEEPRFDLAAWHRPRGNRGKKLRWAVNHARRAGVEVDESWTEAEVLDVVSRWRASLRRPEPKSFMAIAPLAQVDRKRLFVARRAGRAEALLSCARLAEGGWYLEDLVRVPESVNGATELLVCEALERLRAAGAAWASFALAPMRGVDTQLDRRARLLGRLLGVAIRGFDRRYGFRAIARYEERFAPTEWLPRYVAFHPAFPRPAVVRAAVRHLSG